MLKGLKFNLKLNAILLLISAINQLKSVIRKLKPFVAGLIQLAAQIGKKGIA